MHNRARGLCIRIRMRMKSARVLACAVVLCSTVEGAAPTSMSAQAWLSRVPPLPATADAAYAQWVDISGVLKPGPASDQVNDGILRPGAEPLPPGATAGRLAPGVPYSARDKALLEKVSVSPDTGAVLQKIQAAQTAQGALLQKWHAELNALEQRRVQARGALPACHGEAGTPSQAAIRDVEQSFSQQKIEIAVHYLAQFQPLLDQLLTAGFTSYPARRRGHGRLERRLRSPARKAELAPVAHGAEIDALLDVSLIQKFIQDVSKLAARPISERNALGRVYAHAKGC